MTTQLTQELIDRLNHKDQVDREMTIKVDGKVISVLDKYRTAKPTKKGGAGRLEGYGEVAAKLIMYADEHLTEIAGKQGKHEERQIHPTEQKEL